MLTAYTMNIDIIYINGSIFQLNGVHSIHEIKKEIEQKEGKPYNSLGIYTIDSQLQDYKKIVNSRILYCLIYDWFTIQIDDDFYNLPITTTYDELQTFIINKLKKVTDNKTSFIISCNNIKLNKSNYIFYLKEYIGHVIKQSLNSYYNNCINYYLILNNKNVIYKTFKFNEINYNLFVFNNILSLYTRFTIKNIDMFYYDREQIRYCGFSLEDLELYPNTNKNLKNLYYNIDFSKNVPIYNSIKLVEFYIISYINNIKLINNQINQKRRSNITNSPIPYIGEFLLNFDLISNNSNTNFENNLNNICTIKHEVFIYPYISIIKYRDKKDIVEIKWNIYSIDFN